MEKTPKRIKLYTIETLIEYIVDKTCRKKEIIISDILDSLSHDFEGSIGAKFKLRKCTLGDDQFRNYRFLKNPKGYLPNNANIELLFLMFFTKIFPLNTSNYKIEANKLVHYFCEELSERSVYICSQINKTQFLQDIINERPPQDDLELQVSVFHKFIIELFSLEKKDYIPRKKEDVYGCRTSKIDNYMPQSLFLNDGEKTPKNIFCITEEDLYFFEKQENKLLLITGPSGQGKSRFLKELEKKAFSSNVFDFFIRISLVDLLDRISLYDNNNVIIDYIVRKYGQNLMNSTGKVLLGLDGFNEYRTAQNKKNIKLISISINTIVDEIRSKKNINTSLIITTKNIDTTKQLYPAFKFFKCVYLSGTADDTYDSLKYDCKLRNILFEDKNGQTSEIGMLARIPMYANLIAESLYGDNENQDVNENEYDINTTYGLFFEAYKQRAEQRVGNDKDFEKINFDESAYLYMYYIVLPYLAHYVLTIKSSTVFSQYSFHDRDLLKIGVILKRNPNTEVSYERIRNKYFPYLPREIHYISGYGIKDYLSIEDNLIQNYDNKYNYKFEHETWRDFLVAFYLNNNIELLKEQYLSSDSSYLSFIQLDLNVNANVAKMLRQSLRLDGTESENDKRFIEFFAVDKMDFKKLLGILRFQNLAYDFCEYIQVPLTIGENGENETLHKVLSTTSTLFLNLSQNKLLADKIIKTVCADDYLKEYTCGILGKEAEYYRRTKQYEKVANLLDLSMKISDDNLSIRNQRAKLYLSYYQSKKLDETIIDSPDFLAQEELNSIFNQGISLLKELAEKDSFYLSANLYGLLQTCPPPYLLNQRNINIDYNSVFKTYLKVIFNSDSKGREIAYTVCAALSLIFFIGKVRVDEYDENNGEFEYNPSDDFFNNLSLLKLKPYSNNCKMNMPTLKLANTIMHKADGQVLKGINYFRACVCLFNAAEKDTDEERKAEMKKAEEYYNSPHSDEIPILYKIRLKYEFGYDESIDGYYYDLAKMISEDKRNFHIYLEQKKRNDYRSIKS